MKYLFICLSLLVVLAGRPSHAADTCLHAGDSEVLVGPGTLNLYLNEAQFAAADKAVKGKTLRLLIDGIDITDNADLSAIPSYPVEPRGALVCAVLRYELRVNKETSLLWTRRYQRMGAGGLTTLAAVPVLLTDTAKTGGDPVYSTVRKLAVTSDINLTLGTLGLMFIVAGFVYLLLKTDTFRDTMPEWLILARRQLPAYLVAAREDGTLGAFIDTLLAEGSKFRPFDPQRHSMPMKDAVRAYWRSQRLDDGLTQQEIAVGFLLLQGKRLPRPSYSLARVQSGLWFTFALAASVFLSMVYWQLPPLSGSVLGILGITVVGTAVSFQLDSERDNLVGYASRGLLRDLVTGYDDRTHVHRYQSLAVNLMLLDYGIYTVWYALQLPVFDATWLGFLGVSAGFTALGKQQLETAGPGRV